MPQNNKKTFLSYDDVKEEVLRILVEDMKIGGKADFDVYVNMREMDIDLDSMDIVSLVMHIEKETGITIKNSDIKHFRTLDDIIKYTCVNLGIMPDKKTKTEKPIQFVKTNKQSLKFVQGGKTLSLEDPQLQPILKILQDALVNKR